MQFKENATVVTADGNKVGDIDRVVIDPKTRAVTHVVVRKGILFIEDRVVPIDLVASATEERVELREDAGELEDLPKFVEKHFVPLDEAELAEAEYREAYVPPLYLYPPYGVPHTYRFPPAQPPVVAEPKVNVPKETVPLKEGAQVISADGQEVGAVESVLTDPQADKVTHFVIEKGLLLTEKKLIPVDWVNQVYEDRVDVAVSAEFIKGLREYETA